MSASERFERFPDDQWLQRLDGGDAEFIAAADRKRQPMSFQGRIGSL